MPVQAMGETSRIRLQFVESRDQEGKEKLSSRSYSNLKPQADDQAVYNVAATIIGLQEKEAKTITRIDEKELVEE
ncbi:Protein of unknown function [Anaerovirgula multivorans]|uniref:DUF1659 domain-containing protein n=1 Tax=Anaerovirgula multivorans TaxID=312168 RepID=A0A239EXQ9_9FIRM|nr:DUF1659 domain-containing protein [Anaerovirgula multivorans]SNS49409.1 Protein of unknown function [Anaerovirgula multivorans]